MILEVITPDELLYKGNVSQVILPGLDGSFGILNSHAALISALAKGNVRIDQNVSENNAIQIYNGKLNSTISRTCAKLFCRKSRFFVHCNFSLIQEL